MIARSGREAAPRDPSKGAHDAENEQDAEHQLRVRRVRSTPRGWWPRPARARPAAPPCGEFAVALAHAVLYPAPRADGPHSRSTAAMVTDRLARVRGRLPVAPRSPPGEVQQGNL